jgi:two-component system, LytTR family, sensor histidine kinase AlgZ
MALPDKRKGKYLRLVLVILLINLVATLTAVLILSWIGNQSEPWQIKNSFLSSFVYSNCIGTLVAMSIPHLLTRTARRHSFFKWIFLLVVLLALTIVGVLLAGTILVLIGVNQTYEFLDQFYFSMRISILITAGFGIAMFVYHSLRLQLEETALQLRTKELEEERALKLATEARLSSLESRIHPHFLFNTLNSISALIQEDPPLAERLVEKLAALLRFSLDAGHSRLVPLGQELKIVTDYLEIEKARFGERLEYSIDVPFGLEQAQVPPLALQTLVENSVKYAVSPSRSGGSIRVSARGAGDRLQIEVWDNGPGFSAEKIIAGHGLENLQSRLTALFGGDAKMDISTQNGGTAIAITLPQEGENHKDTKDTKISLSL